jgi:uncharacterized short protein YbdD (DUF466 family)
MENFINKNYNYGYDFIPVLAEKLVIDDEYVKKPFGIPELKEKSVIRAKEAVKISSYENYVNQAKIEMKEQIEKMKNNLQSFLDDKIIPKIDNMEGGKNNKEICEDLKNLLLNLISYNIYNGTRKYISNESESLIDEFIKKIFDDKLSESFNKQYENYIDEQKNNIYEDLLKSEINEIEKFKIVENEINVIINDLFNKEFLLYKLLYRKAWISYIKTYIKKICADCVLELGENTNSIFKEILIQEDFKTFVTKLVEKDFDKIKKDLKL